MKRAEIPFNQIEDWFRTVLNSVNWLLTVSVELGELVTDCECRTG